jgi:hypothetical protein
MADIDQNDLLLELDQLRQMLLARERERDEAQQKLVQERKQFDAERQALRRELSELRSQSRDHDRELAEILGRLEEERSRSAQERRELAAELAELRQKCLEQEAFRLVNEELERSLAELEEQRSRLEAELAAERRAVSQAVAEATAELSGRVRALERELSQDRPGAAAPQPLQPIEPASRTSVPLPLPEGVAAAGPARVAAEAELPVAQAEDQLPVAQAEVAGVVSEADLPVAEEEAARVASGTGLPAAAVERTLPEPMEVDEAPPVAAEAGLVGLAPPPSSSPAPAETRAASPALLAPAPPPQERRRSPRRTGNPVRLEVVLPASPDEPLTGWVLDRSAGGIRVLLDQEVAVGSRLKVHACNAPDWDWVEVEVRHTCTERGSFSLGCQFVEELTWTSRKQFG